MTSRILSGATLTTLEIHSPGISSYRPQSDMCDICFNFLLPFISIQQPREFDVDSHSRLIMDLKPSRIDGLLSITLYRR